jgi:hypothetical protein
MTVSGDFIVKGVDCCFSSAFKGLLGLWLSGLEDCLAFNLFGDSSNIFIPFYYYSTPSYGAIESF